MNNGELENFLIEKSYDKADFFNKIEGFNQEFIERFLNSKSLEKGKFPFGSVLPENCFDTRMEKYPIQPHSLIHTVYYIPYFPPKAKELYPYSKTSPDLEYWKDKRQEYSKFLNNFNIL